jgi:hypothetical protein
MRRTAERPASAVSVLGGGDGAGPPHALSGATAEPVPVRDRRPR